MTKLLNFLIYILILSLPLGQLGKLPFVGNGVNIYIQDILTFVVLIVWLLHTFLSKKQIKVPFLGFLISIFAGVGLISLISGSGWLSGSEFLVSGLYWLRWVLYGSIFFVVHNQASQLKDFKNTIINLLILSGIILAVAGFIQLALVPDFGHMAVTAGWDPHKNRLLSTFFDPNFTGAYLVLTLNLVLSKFLLRPRLFVKSNLTTGLVGAILLVALALTFSRSAWLMFAVSIFVFGLLRSRKLVLSALLVFLLAYLVVPRVQTRIAGGVDPDDSARLRFVSWGRTLEIANEHPLLGVGFNAYRYAQQRHGFFDWNVSTGGHSGAGADSSLLFVLATTGIFGLVLYCTLLLQAGLQAFSKKHCVSGMVVLVSLAGLLVESNFINSLFYSPIVIWWWILLGLL